MSDAITSIREAIRAYENSDDDIDKKLYAAKIKFLGRIFDDARPWAEAFEIVVTWNNEQQADFNAWHRRVAELSEMIRSALHTRGTKETLTHELQGYMLRRHHYRDNRIAAYSTMTRAMIDAKNPYQRFDLVTIPNWLLNSFDFKGKEPAGGGRVCVNGEYA